MLSVSLTIAAFVALTATLALRGLRSSSRESSMLATVTSRIGVVMAEGLGVREALPGAISLIVPEAADWALVHLVSAHGGVSRSIVHRDPAIQADIERLHARVPFKEDMPYGPPEVIRTGVSSFVPRISLETIARASNTYPEYAEIMRRIGLGSQIIVPLRARTSTVGAITLGRAAGRPFTKAHLAWAEDLGHRIGLAVENARLYDEARQLFEQTLSANYVSTPAGRILACNQTFAPYQVCITPLSVAVDNACMKHAEAIYAELTARGVEVILDDRDERPGVKFKDADLVGFPIRVSIGEKSLANGEIEIKPRGGAMALVKMDEVVNQVLALVNKSSK